MGWQYFFLLLVISICHATPLPTFKLPKESSKRDSKATVKGIHYSDSAFSDDVEEKSYFIDSGKNDHFGKTALFVTVDQSGWSENKGGKAKKTGKSLGWQERADSTQVYETGWSPLFGKKIQAAISGVSASADKKVEAANPSEGAPSAQESDRKQVGEESSASKLTHDSFPNVYLPHYESENSDDGNKRHSDQVSLFSPNIEAENANQEGSTGHVGYSHPNIGAQEGKTHPTYVYDRTYLSNAEPSYFQNQFSQNEHDDHYKDSGSKGTAPGWILLSQETFGHVDGALGTGALQNGNADQDAILTDNSVDGPVRGASVGRAVEYYGEYENGQDAFQKESISGNRGGFLEDKFYLQQPIPQFGNVAFTIYHGDNRDQWDQKSQSVLIPHGPVVESVQVIPSILLVQHGQLSLDAHAVQESHETQDVQQNTDEVQNMNAVSEAVVSEDEKKSEGAKEGPVPEDAPVSENAQASAEEQTSIEVQLPEEAPLSKEAEASNEAQVYEEAQISDDVQVSDEIAVTEEAKASLDAQDNSAVEVSQDVQDLPETQTTMLAEVDLLTGTTHGFSESNSADVVSVNHEVTSEVVAVGVTEDSMDNEFKSVTEGNESPESTPESSDESEKYITASPDSVSVYTEGELESSTPEDDGNIVNTDEGCTNTNRVAEAYTGSSKQGSSFVAHKGPGKYHFRYEVNNEKTGDIKSHEEEREGDFTKGTYSLHDPDGTIRTVDYHVKGPSGFQAMVNREGIAMHPRTKRDH